MVHLGAYAVAVEYHGHGAGYRFTVDNCLLFLVRYAPTGYGVYDYVTAVGCVQRVTLAHGLHVGDGGHEVAHEHHALDSAHLDEQVDRVLQYVMERQTSLFNQVVIQVDMVVIEGPDPVAASELGRQVEAEQCAGTFHADLASGYACAAQLWSGGLHVTG